MSRHMLHINATQLRSYHRIVTFNDETRQPPLDLDRVHHRADGTVEVYPTGQKRFDLDSRDMLLVINPAGSDE